MTIEKKPDGSVVVSTEGIAEALRGYLIERDLLEASRVYGVEFHAQAGSIVAVLIPEGFFITDAQRPEGVPVQ